MHKIDRLTSIRGVAALWVVLFHAQGVVPGFNLTPWTQIVEKGYLAVDVFFVLSGFILAHVYAATFDAGRGEYWRFLTLRLARIYPVHLIMLAIVVSIWGLGDTLLFNNSPRTLAANALLMQAWGVSRKLSFNFPSWSVSAEWFAYLAFPVLLSLSKPFARRPAFAIVASIAAIVSLALAAAQLLPDNTRAFDLAARFALVRVSFEFMAGLLLYRACSAISSIASDHRIVIERSTVVVIAALVLTLHTASLAAHVQDALAVSLAGLLILCLAVSNSAGGVMSSRAAVFLGEASYSIYMVHGAVVLAYMQLVDRHLVPSQESLAAATMRVTVGVALIIALGIAMYWLVEVPARAAIRNLAGRARLRA